jgi:hypothetical protein
MDGEGAVLEVEESLETPGSEGEGAGEQPGGGEQQQQQEDPYSSKASREYSQWLKGLRESGDPTAAKFARLAKDNHGSMYALKQLDPKGIDGVRERYALLDSVIHNDPERGELKGPEAIAALQDSVREIGEIDAKIAAGDATALDSFDDEMKAGIVKMAPAILDLAKSMNPEGYKEALTPHLVDMMQGGGMIPSLAALTDVLNEKPPTWLTDGQKTAWTQDKFGRLAAQTNKMVDIWNALNDKAAKSRSNDTVPRGTNGKGDPLADRDAKQTEREQNYHWNTNISPKLDQHAATEFQKLFAPYAKRLNLDAPTANSLKMEFSKRVASAAAKDAAYMGQLKRYRAMKDPDPATVLNFAKVNFDKHSKSVMESLVNERYKPFLNGKPRAVANGNGKAAPLPPAGIQVVTVRPADGTHNPKMRTLQDVHNKIFYLNNGKKVQVRA